MGEGTTTAKHDHRLPDRSGSLSGSIQPAAMVFFGKEAKPDWWRWKLSSPKDELLGRGLAR